MKNKLPLVILLLISFNYSKAQNNWKTLYYQTFNKMSVDNNYIWASNHGNLLRINTDNYYYEEMLDSMSRFNLIDGLVSNDNECWISVYKTTVKEQILRRYQGNNFKEFRAKDLGITDNRRGSYLLANSISYFPDKSKLLFYNYSLHYFLYYRNNSFREIKIKNNAYYTGLTILDDNTIICKENSNVVLLDTNGTIKKTFTASILSYPNSYINNFSIDNNKNIYFGVSGIGIIKVNCSTIDSVKTLFVSMPTFGLQNNYRAFVKYCNNNTILIANNEKANVYNLNGDYLTNFTSLPPAYDPYFDNLLNITKYNDLVSSNTQQLLKYSNSTFVDMITYRNRGASEQILSASFGLNGINLLASQKQYYHINNNNVNFSKINVPNSQKIIFGSTIDYLGNIWVNTGSNLIKIDANGTIVLTENLPTGFTNFAINPNGVKVNTNNEIQLISKNLFAIYNQNNGNWNLFNKSGTINELYSFENDNVNNITWFGTDKGIATLINNNVTINNQINENYPTGSIKYSKKYNSLVYISIPTYTKDLFIYNLELNKKFKFHIDSILPGSNLINSIEVDLNGDIWVATDKNGILKFNMQQMSWDMSLHFNFTNSDISTNNFKFIKIDSANNKYFFADPGPIYIFNENGLVLSNQTNLKVEKRNVLIFPNPTNSSLTIHQDTEIQSIKVYDLQGKMLMKHENIKEKSFTLDFNKRLEKGVYIIETTDINKRIVTSRFIYED